MYITLKKLELMLPNNTNHEELYDAFVECFNKYDIITIDRIACFMAQCSHESVHFTKFVENLNYSAKAICTVWSKRFKSEADALPYARNPQKLANKVYCNRMGNGSEQSGEGYKFIGRGAIQLTGKNNYTNFATHKDITLDECITYLSTIKGAIESSCFYWKSNNLNELADERDIKAITKVINPGLLGLEERSALYIKYKMILSN